MADKTLDVLMQTLKIIEVKIAAGQDRPNLQHETKIRKGQALNMAVAAAQQLQRPKDVKLIYELAAFYEAVCMVYQECSIDEMKDVLEKL